METKSETRQPSREHMKRTVRSGRVVVDGVPYGHAELTHYEGLQVRVERQGGSLVAMAWDEQLPLRPDYSGDGPSSMSSDGNCPRSHGEQERGLGNDLATTTCEYSGAVMGTVTRPVDAGYDPEAVEAQLHAIVAGRQDRS